MNWQLQQFAITKIGQVADLAMTVRLPGKFWIESHSFVADGLLIDTGIACFGEALSQTLNPGEIRYIVNTGPELTSLGNNRLLQTRFSLPIYAHRDCLPYIRKPELLGRQSLAQRIVWGQPRAAKGRRIIRNLSGQSLKFQIISPGAGFKAYIGLYERSNGWLFSGSLFKQLPSPIWQSMCEQLNVKVIFCGLRGAVTE